jgi:malonyl-CoA O-methyltransferase
VAALRWASRTAGTSPWLHEEVASRMAGRLQWFREPPASWLHWEPVNGGLQAHGLLLEQLPRATSFVAARDGARTLAALRGPRPAWHPAQWLRRAPARLATDQTQVAMLWANMALHMEPEPMRLLRHWHSRIETGGFLMFSSLGPDSLRALRLVHARQGWPEPAHAFTDMHDWGDMLVQVGFAEPVMDMERITLSYSSADTLLAELRGLGRNLSLSRHPSLRGRGWRARWCEAVEQGLPRSSDGRLLLDFEIVYGHAFKAAPRVPVSASSTVSVDDMRALLRAGRR